VRTVTVGSDFDRQVITCPDGGLIALDWWRDSKSGGGLSPNTPIVLVMHGLAGGSTEGYCKWMCDAARSKGWRVAVINYR
jgi:predicted alpha/beta-fold hydrolase